MTSIELFDKIDGLLGHPEDATEADIYKVVDYILENFEEK